MGDVWRKAGGIYFFKPGGQGEETVGIFTKICQQNLPTKFVNKIIMGDVWRKAGGYLCF